MAHTLLLADDSVTIQRVVELTFAGEDIRVVAVGNGQQAIDRLSDDPPDIVLADIGMPLLDGYAVASFIRNHDALRAVPVLLMVGAFDPVDEDRVQASGAAGVLVKPFEPTLVISRVKELLGLGARPEPTTILPLAPDAAPVDQPNDAAASLPAPEAAEPGSDVEPVTAGQEPAEPTSPAPSAVADFEQDWLGQDLSERLVAKPAVPAEAPLASVEALWAEFPGPESGAPSTPPVTFASPPPGASVADAFSALLAAEQGEPAPAAAVPEFEPPPIEAIIDQVTAQVIERLGTQAVRDRVDRIVLEVSERLVREEIARIREAAARRD